MQPILPVILSGGSGTRLWPMSRQLYPKQLLPLCGTETLLQQTVARVAGKARFAPPLIVANEEHRFIIAEQLRQAGREPGAILLEPQGRNTAPAIALAALAARDADAVLLVMPSDHLIQNTAAFHDAIARAQAAVAATGGLATFGIHPTRPETGYGYIQRGAPLNGHEGCFRVARFVEKPDSETAQSYLAQGGYDWNSGMFLFRAGDYLNALAQHAHPVAQACQQAFDTMTDDGLFKRPGAAAWAAMPSVSIDYAVMEKTGDAIVVPADLGWSDIGSWAALADVSPRDAAGNTAIGDVVSEDTAGCYLRSDGPMLAAVGLRDLVVVATPDAVLVAEKAASQDVRAIVAHLENQKRGEHIAHVVVYRPWGSYQTIDRGERFQAKRLVVNPGAKLSLQMHHHRAEHWVVVKGTARVTRGEDIITLHENESTFIPAGAVHRLENPGKIPLHLIEVQSGSYLGEDDIVRLEDHYGRV